MSSWKILESAFGLTDGGLLDKLAEYEPIQNLIGDGDLMAWLVLRGRASHAQSRVGTKELIAVERSCESEIWKLKKIVERVIITKKSWGYPTTAWEERLPQDLRARRAGEPILVSDEESLRQGASAPRRGH
ncbi:MAG: hypothetical protein WKF73_09585 [Nocardioidaceae bacterium]